MHLFKCTRMRDRNAWQRACAKEREYLTLLNRPFVFECVYVKIPFKWITERKLKIEAKKLFFFFKILSWQNICPWKKMKNRCFYISAKESLSFYLFINSVWLLLAEYILSVLCERCTPTKTQHQSKILRSHNNILPCQRKSAVCIA